MKMEKLIILLKILVGFFGIRNELGNDEVESLRLNYDMGKYISCINIIKKHIGLNLNFSVRYVRDTPSNVKVDVRQIPTNKLSARKVEILINEDVLIDSFELFSYAVTFELSRAMLYHHRHFLMNNAFATEILAVVMGLSKLVKNGIDTSFGMSGYDLRKKGAYLSCREIDTLRQKVQEMNNWGYGLKQFAKNFFTKGANVFVGDGVCSKIAVYLKSKYVWSNSYAH